MGRILDRSEIVWTARFGGLKKRKKRESRNEAIVGRRRKEKEKGLNRTKRET